jgi:hypothetical protein
MENPIQESIPAVSTPEPKRNLLLKGIGFIAGLIVGILLLAYIVNPFAWVFLGGGAVLLFGV